MSYLVTAPCSAPIREPTELEGSAARVSPSGSRTEIWKWFWIGRLVQQVYQDHALPGLYQFDPQLYSRYKK